MYVEGVMRLIAYEYKASDDPDHKQNSQENRGQKLEKSKTPQGD